MQNARRTRSASTHSKVSMGETTCVSNHNLLTKYHIVCKRPDAHVITVRPNTIVFFKGKRRLDNRRPGSENAYVGNPMRFAKVGGETVPNACAQYRKLTRCPCIWSPRYA